MAVAIADVLSGLIINDLILAHGQLQINNFLSKWPMADPRDEVYP